MLCTDTMLECRSIGVGTRDMSGRGIDEGFDLVFWFSSEDVDKYLAFCVFV